MRSDIGWFEGQDDPVGRDPGGDHVVRHPVVGAVVLDPDFAATDVDVHDASVNASMLIPSGIKQLVVVVGLVEDRLYLDLADGGGDRRISFDQASDDPA